MSRTCVHIYIHKGSDKQVKGSPYTVDLKSDNFTVSILRRTYKILYTMVAVCGGEGSPYTVGLKSDNFTVSILRRAYKILYIHGSYMRGEVIFDMVRTQLHIMTVVMVTTAHM